MTPTPEAGETAVLPGAEPFSAAGGPHGALVLHGFTGNPSSLRSLAQAFAAAGWAVELPRLPGHGTTVEDMMGTSWDDWSATAEATYQDLAARCEKVVVAGLSMGGTLTLWLAARHPEVAGIVCVNPATVTPEPMRHLVQALLAQDLTVMEGIGSDIAKPGVSESAYPQTPMPPLMSLMAAFDELQGDLGRITCPLLLMNSPQDHVVLPSDSDHLAASVQGPVERVTLGRSYHVATLDYDADEIERRAVEFAAKVVAG